MSLELSCTMPCFTEFAIRECRYDERENCEWSNGVRSRLLERRYLTKDALPPSSGVEKENTLRDNRNAFLPSLVPRITAAFWVVVLLGGLSMVCIFSVAFVAPVLSHGQNVNHVAGKVLDLGPGRDFVLITAQGHQLSFICGNSCRASLAHLQRHKAEKANTDVYYIIGPNQSLVALDVD